MPFITPSAIRMAKAALERNAHQTVQRSASKPFTPAPSRRRSPAGHHDGPDPALDPPQDGPAHDLTNSVHQTQYRPVGDPNAQLAHEDLEERRGGDLALLHVPDSFAPAPGTGGQPR